ncbi:DEAD/DEAH box helicase [Cryobacterium psychrophilum]|uniref:DEAD/DEAH box helicase n=1 Tax=Cryobacterium psychrophilum TaxID=41988 RepID=UPI0014170C31|nr:DEAD/DEAH box helicase [Cryobacterium psychrophilum]
MDAHHLDADIDAVEQRIASLETDLAESRRVLHGLLASRAAHPIESGRPDTTQPIAGSDPGQSVQARVRRESSAADKIALFRSLFVGRADVYATRWTSSKTGKSGWSPAVRGGYYTDGVTTADLLPLSDEVIERHLVGSRSDAEGLHAGLYPMLNDDTCRLLVCDFDDGTWKADAAAYAQACARHGVCAATEISRSGEGAHVWIFFAQAVSAHNARNLGLALLREAISFRSGMSLSSYDRLFPSQDLLPHRAPGRMRLGNLIALPLQGSCRRRGTTVFVDPVTWMPFEDQFGFLSSVVPLDAESMATAISALRPMRTGPVDTKARPRKTSGSADPFSDRSATLNTSGPATVLVTVNSVVSIPTLGLPSGLVADLKHSASLTNPEFYRRQAQRFSTFGTPRFVYCFEHDESTLRLPRGLLDSVIQLMAAAGIKIDVAWDIPASEPIDLVFRGELTAAQSEAVTVMNRYDTGVLVAPPGSGKTVIACALIAERGLPTAVIVNRAELVDQWRERLGQFLDIDPRQIGQLGNGRRKRTHVIDIVMLQSIAHRAADPTILNRYGLIVVDECHSLGAAATEAAVRQVAVRQWIGLTATPYRADQMDDIITMQCGPIRHTIDDPALFERELVVHETAFRTSEQDANSPEIQAIYTELVGDGERNQRIAADVLAAYRAGRNCLVLSTRIEHVARLAELLGTDAATVFVLHGKLTPNERRRIRTEMTDRDPCDPFILVAIDKIAGEGFDLPSLDTLFLAVSMAFKGRIVQQIGRISRASRPATTRPGPATSQVHDYWDAQVPVFDRMFRKRQRVMAKLGFTTPAES